MNNIKIKTLFTYFDIELKKKYFTQKVPRNFKIVQKYVGSNFQIYNGKASVNLIVTNEMVGHKFGEFIPTRSKYVFKKKKK